MKIASADIYGVDTILNDGELISHSGNLTIFYKMVNPQPFSLDEDLLARRHDDMVRAIDNLIPGSYLHKQDIFLRKEFTSSGFYKENGSKISQWEADHFNGREYHEHHCVLGFTICNLATLSKAYQSRILSSDKMEKRDLERLKSFQGGVVSCINILNSLSNTQLHKMTRSEVIDHFHEYANLFAPFGDSVDVSFSAENICGKQKVEIFAFSDPNNLPNEVLKTTEEKRLNNAASILFSSFLEDIGLNVKIRSNHIYNQIIYQEGHDNLIKQLDAKVATAGQNRNWSSSIKAKHKELSQYRESVDEDNVKLCKFHCSYMVFDDDSARLETSVGELSKILDNRGIKKHTATHYGAFNLFLGNNFGAENKIYADFYMITDTDVAVAMMLHSTNFKSDYEGIAFNDRIYQTPLRLDIWDADKKRINARNGIIVSGTGGGKSATAMSMIAQLLEQGVKVVVVEFGKSFSNLMKMYPEKSMHIDYDGTRPIGINSFSIQDHTELTNEKVQTLATLVLKYWRSKNILDDTHQKVSLIKIIRDYYSNVHSGHSFEGFYLYIKNNIDQILSRLDIKQEYFDAPGFLHICSDFITGGIYENVTKVNNEFQNEILDKDFIVFELTKIKKDPFLISLVMTILYETIENKITKDRSQRGILIYDEYAETAHIKDMFTEATIHETVAFAYQKFRKENGAIFTIVQSPAQLPKNEYTAGIISNTQLLFVLPTTEKVYADTIELFNIKNNAHIAQMKSIRNAFKSTHPYAEVFIRFADTAAIVVRLEFSRKKYYAIQTEGADWKFLDDSYQETKNMEKSIEALMIKKGETV